jgi:hypothetical protein
MCCLNFAHNAIASTAQSLPSKASLLMEHDVSPERVQRDVAAAGYLLLVEDVCRC